MTCSLLALAVLAASTPAVSHASSARSAPACGPEALVPAAPNIVFLLADHRRAIRSPRYKLMRRSNRPDELYDLSADEFEATNLLAVPLTPLQQAALEALEAELAALGVP